MEIKCVPSPSLNADIFRDFNSEYIDGYMAYNDIKVVSIWGHDNSPWTSKNKMM